MFKTAGMRGAAYAEIFANVRGQGAGRRRKEGGTEQEKEGSSGEGRGVRGDLCQRRGAGIRGCRAGGGQEGGGKEGGRSNGGKEGRVGGRGDGGRKYRGVLSQCR